MPRSPEITVLSDGDCPLCSREVRMLDSVGESLTESITLKLSVDFVTDEVITEIHKVCQKHKGSHKLKLQIFVEPAKCAGASAGTRRATGS